MTKNVLTDTRGPELVGPGFHSLVWDVDGRAWLQDRSTGWWDCEAPAATLPWSELRAVAGPVFALPGVQAGRCPVDPMAAAGFRSREAALRGERRKVARNVGRIR